MMECKVIIKMPLKGDKYCLYTVMECEVITKMPYKGNKYLALNGGKY